jgi:hypothetical protein
MNILFKATDDFMVRVRKDLSRAHSFADERVGFIAVRATMAAEQLVLLVQDYYPVADEDYIRDPSIGAMISQEAFRRMLEIALLNQVGIFHVHQHLFPGRLWFSSIDLREQVRFVPDFFKVRPNMPHGALVLSSHAAAGRVWLAPDKIEPIREFNIVGPQIKVSHSSKDGSVDFYV